MILMLMMIMPFINVLAVAFSAPLASMEHGIILWPQESVSMASRRCGSTSTCNARS